VGPERRPAPNWKIADPSIAAAELSALDAWLRWFVPRYNLTSLVPPCWTQHPPMVEELSALYAAWRGAYSDPAANPDAGLTWHEQLDRWRARWANWNPDNCNVNVHRPTVEVEWSGHNQQSRSPR